MMYRVAHKKFEVLGSSDDPFSETFQRESLFQTEECIQTENDVDPVAWNRTYDDYTTITFVTYK